MTDDLEFGESIELDNGLEELVALYREDSNLIDKMKEILALLDDAGNISNFTVSTFQYQLQELLGENGAAYFLDLLANGVPDELEGINQRLFLQLGLLFAKYNTFYECALKYITNPLTYVSVENVGKNRGMFKIVRADREQLVLKLNINSLSNLTEHLFDKLINMMREGDDKPANHEGLMTSIENYLKASGVIDDTQKS